MIFEIISGTTLVVIMTALFINNRKLKKEGDDLAVLLVEEHFKMQKQKAELEEMANLAPIDTNDGFVKFLSQSREWAYNYIDVVQEKFTEFDALMSVSLEKTALNEDEIKELSVAYITLKQSVMPENDKMPNE
jgi:hypothetical protein